MSIVDQKLERFLSRSEAFLTQGFDRVNREIQSHLWEKSTLAGMCAYLLHALAAVDPGGAESIAADLERFDDLEGEALADWVSDQLDERAIAAKGVVR